jgi:hypothetical protein
MRAAPLVLIVLALACSKKSPSEPAKLRKMDWKLAIDERGRMLPEIELFDQHHTPIVVAPASYTLTVSRPDNTVLCSLTRTLAKEDYDKTRLKSDWQDASCPADPAADELRVTLEVRAGDKPDAPKVTRDKTTPTKFIYRHLAAKPAAPATGSGSAAGSGDAKMITPEKPEPTTGSGSSGSAGSGSAGSGSAGSGSAAGSAGSAGSGSAK